MSEFERAYKPTTLGVTLVLMLTLLLGSCNQTKSDDSSASDEERATSERADEDEPAAASDDDEETGTSETTEDDSAAEAKDSALDGELASRLEGIALPVSTSTVPLADGAARVYVDDDALRLDDEKILVLDAGRVDAALRSGGPGSLRVDELSTALEDRADEQPPSPPTEKDLESDSALQIAADADTPFDTLAVIMQSAYMSGFEDVQLVAAKGESLGESGKPASEAALSGPVMLRITQPRLDPRKALGKSRRLDEVELPKAGEILRTSDGHIGSILGSGTPQSADGSNDHPEPAGNPKSANIDGAGLQLEVKTPEGKDLAPADAKQVEERVRSAGWRCLRSSLKKHGGEASGEATATLFVSSSGRALKVDVDADTVERGYSECLDDRLSRARYPTTGDAYGVKLELRFAEGEGEPFAPSLLVPRKNAAGESDEGADAVSDAKRASGEVAVPMLGSPDESGDGSAAPPEMKEARRLRVLVHADGRLTVVPDQRPRLIVGGCDGAPASICARDADAAPLERYDWLRLYRTLHGLHRKSPDLDTLELALERDVPHRVLIRAMDLARHERRANADASNDDAKPQAAHEAPDSLEALNESAVALDADGKPEAMFPKIVLAVPAR